MWYTLLADLTVVAHLGYVLFLIGGLLLIWIGRALGWEWVHRKWFRLFHLACILIVVVEALCGWECPLTTWERALRRLAGQTPDELSFVARIVRDVLFYRAPARVFRVCYVVFGILVVATFFLVPMRRRSLGASTGRP